MAYRLSDLDLQRCYSSYSRDFQGCLPDFSADWRTSSMADKEAVFRRELHILQQSYGQLGRIGQLFAEEFIKTGCQETKVLDDEQTPMLQGHHRHRGYQNEIYYGGWCFENREKFQDSSNHERVHAIQHSVSAIAHAIPFNGHRFTLLQDIAGMKAGTECRIVLAPLSYIFIEELKERGSYTMQKILSDLRKGAFDPQIHLGKPMRDYAATVLEKWDVAGSNPVITHLAHYRKYALKNYKGMMFGDDGQPDDPHVIYVFPDAKDMVPLGHICGLTMFGDKTDDMSVWKKSPLSSVHQAEADSMATRLGADKAVPFRTALSAIGMKPQEYLARCRIPLPPQPIIAPGAVPCTVQHPVLATSLIAPKAEPALQMA